MSEPSRLVLNKVIISARDIEARSLRFKDAIPSTRLTVYYGKAEKGSIDRLTPLVGECGG